MLNAVITWSLRHRFLVIALTVLLVITGAYSAVRLPVDAFPDTTPVQVQINTVAPALTPLEIEQQITFPVEQSISGLKGLKEVRSLSKFGLSQVTVIFEDGVDIYFARQLVMERLGTVDLPDDLPNPTMGPVATGLGEVFHYILTSQTRSLSELRTIQDWIIKPQLRSVSGVAEVNSWGGLKRQYQVVVDPNRLLKYDLTLLDVFEALRRNNLNVGGGNITRAGQSLLVQGVGLLTTLKQVEDVVIKSEDGVPVYVQNIGEVVDGHEIRRGAVTYGGQEEAVLGLGFMLMGENTREVTERMKEQMERIRPSLPDDVEVTEVYDRTELVDHVLHTVETNLFEGAVLVIAVLFFFLGNLRAGLIVASAIPLSMLFAANGMLRAGIAGSLMSLGAIDFGLIVDSSVIQIENSVRHLARNRTGRPRIDVVRDAALEVRKPTMFGELIIMIVYLPILTLEGIEGKLFRPMALTVIFALLGSLVLSLTLMPVLASLLLPEKPRDRDLLIVRAAKRLYEPVLNLALRRGGVILVLVSMALIGGIFMATRLGTVFIPRLSEEAVVINTVRLAGVSVDESVRYGTQIERLLLRKFPDEIRHIWSRTGAPEVATDPMGLELTDIFITLNPRKQWTRAESQAELVELIEVELAGMPAMRTIFTQPIEMRVNEMVAGIRSDLGVKLFGDDFETLESLAAQLAEVLQRVPGASDVTVEQVTGQPLLEVRTRQDQLARYGIAAGDVLDFVASIGNVQVGEIRQGQVRFPLTVRLPDEYRTDPERVGNLLIPTAAGQRLPLYHLADLGITEGPSTINREWSKRRVIVQCNARGRDIGGLVREAEERIASEIKLPTGYFVRFGGQFEHLERASQRLIVVVPLALLLVFLLLYLTYGRVADVLRIIMTLPLAAIGGIVALHLRDMPFSVSAGVGFVAMSGVSVLGDMVYVSFLRDLLERGRPLGDAIREAALTRLRPVLMTGLVASLGFVPMAFNTGVGAEVQRPLATVVIGCVVTSTLLTLFVLPVMYSFLGCAQGDRRRAPGLSGELRGATC
ncbi:MAG: efflux RND transporter permease subunit [Phycisphaerales bacterium]|nr:MAG: efflux RND transporter permease subunit [Phycisphaerales bacterium]